MFYQLHAHPLSISLMNYYQVLNIILKEPHLLRGFSISVLFLMKGCLWLESGLQTNGKRGL